MLKIKDNKDMEDIKKYLELFWHTCYVEDKLNTYRYRIKGTGLEIEITNKKIHFGNSNCEWLENLYNFLTDLVEKVEDK